MSNRLNSIFRSIADPTRREIFHLLVVTSAALSISQIADHFDISRQGITKHLKVMQQAGLLDISVKGERAILHGKCRAPKGNTRLGQIL